MRIRMRRILCAAAAVMMLSGSVLSAQADTTTNRDTLTTVTGTTTVSTAETVTITNIPTNAASLSFDTYQVLYATYVSSSNSLEYHLTPWANAALAGSVTGQYSTETEAIEAIANLTTTTAGTPATEQTDLVNLLGAYIASTGASEYGDATLWSYNAGSGGTDGSATASLPVGAYLVIPASTNMAFLNMLVSVDATAAGSDNKWKTEAHGAVLKGNLIGLTKTVKETADTSATAGEATDVQIGQNVTYTLTADVPRFAANATKTTFKIVDEPTNVKIIESTIRVYGVVSGGSDVLLTKGTNYTQEIDSSGNLTIDFSGKYFQTFYTSSTDTWPYTKVKITYEAELTSDALVNNANENTATLTYGDANHTENTAEDKAKVYTYQMTVTKTAEDTAKKLQGASFSISLNGSALSFIQSGSTPATYKVADTDDISANPSSIVTKITTGTDGTVTLTGLDADKSYTIEEVTAPSGYSLNSNVLEFTISAPATLNGNISKVTSTEYTDSSKSTPAASGSTTWTASADNTKITLSVKDTTIPALPATGSVGIIVFTVLGVAIMIAAILLMYSSRKRKES